MAGYLTEKLSAVADIIMVRLGERVLRDRDRCNLELSDISSADCIDYKSCGIWVHVNFVQQ